MSDIGEDNRDDPLSKPFDPPAQRNPGLGDGPHIDQEAEVPVEEVPEQESHLPEEDIPAVEPRMTHVAKTQEEEEAEAAQPKVDC